MKIIQATKRDAVVLKKLFANSLQEERKFNNNIDLENGINHFERIFPELFKENVYFLAEDEEKIVGFIGGKIERKSEFYKNRRIGAIYDLFVEQKYRGRKIGTRLIKTFISWLKTKKIKIIEIDVSPKNRTAIKLYENLGFKESNIQMRKKI